MTTSPPIAQAIDALGREYNRLTGLTLSHRGVCNPREYAWHQFLKAGFTTADLMTVVLHIRRGIRDGRRFPGALRFSNLIERLDLFEEELALAKAEQRNAVPPRTPRERVLAQARPAVSQTTPGDATVTAKPIGQLIADLKAAAGMRI